MSLVSGSHDEARARAAFLLGISPDADQAEALAGYHRQLETMHPRAGGDRSAYRALLAAWAVWNQLASDGHAAPSLADAARLREVSLLAAADAEEQELRAMVVATDHSRAEQLGRALDAMPDDDVEEDVVIDLRSLVYEVDLEAIEALPRQHRAYATAGSAAVIRTAAGHVSDYA